MTNMKYLLLLILATLGLTGAAGCGAMNAMPDAIVYRDAAGDIDMISSYNQPLALGQPALPSADAELGQ